MRKAFWKLMFKFAVWRTSVACVRAEFFYEFNMQRARWWKAKSDEFHRRSM